MEKVKDANVVAFEKRLAEWRPSYRWESYSFVAIKTNENFKLIFGRLQLIAGVGESAAKDLRVETKSLVAGRKLVPLPSEASINLDAMAQGSVEFSGETHVLEPSSGGRFNYHYYSLYPSWYSGGARLPTLTIQGTQRHDVLVPLGDQRELDWELRALDQPYESVDHVCSLLGFPPLLQSGDSCRLEIIASEIASIAPGSRISGRKLGLECIAASALDVAKIKVGVNIFHKVTIERKSVGGHEMSWRTENEMVFGTLSMPVEDAPVVHVFLSYNDLALHDWWIADPTKTFNARYAAHTAVDPNSEKLKLLLSGKTKNLGNDFEEGVALLLHLLGFSVSHFGSSGLLKDGPDLFAVAPNGSHLAIECTTRELDKNDKLAKLVSRTSQLMRELSASGNGHVKVQAVIVSAATRDEVQAGMKTAGENKVAVVTRAEINNLLDRLYVPADANRLFEEAADLIPRVESGDLPFGPLVR